MIEASLKDEVLKSLERRPYPVNKMKGMGLEYSKIPKEEATRLLIYIDEASHVEFAAKALRHRLTVDELLRRLIWAYNALY